jgi:hypothetical protein
VSLAGRVDEGVATAQANAATQLEMLSAAVNDEFIVTEVIRPAAVLPELAARAILADLALDDVRAEGVWLAEPSSWRRYDRAWDGADGGPGAARLIGELQVAYGTPTRYDVTVFRVTISSEGAAGGWTVAGLCDEAFGFGGLTLATCPRAALNEPPRPFRLR